MTMHQAIQPDLRTDTVLSVDGLKAYYLMNYYGVRREVRAVDDISLDDPAQRDLRHRRRILERQVHR